MSMKRALWGVMLMLITLPPMQIPARGDSPRPNPEASGLFTPNSPGNAAAYHAQMNGGLTGSPIVDGNGSNMHITIPTPSNPSEQFNRQPQRQGAADYLDSTSVYRAPAVVPNGTIIRGASVLVPGAPTTRTAPNLVPNAFSNRHPIALPHSRARATKNQVSSIGDLTGSITYADGKKVLLGTRGTATVDPSKGTLSLPDGGKLSMKNAGKFVRQAARKNQVRL